LCFPNISVRRDYSISASNPVLHFFSLRDNSRLLSLQKSDQVTNLQRNIDQAFQALGGRHRVLALVVRVLLDVQSHSRTLASCAAQTEDDARTVTELHDLALVLRHAVVHRVCVIEVRGCRDSERLGPRSKLLADQGTLGNVFVKRGDELVSTLGGDFLIIVAREERAAVLLIVVQKNLLDSNQRFGIFVGVSQDVKPSFLARGSAQVDRYTGARTDNSPDTILLSDVVGTRPK